MKSALAISLLGALIASTAPWVRAADPLRRPAVAELLEDNAEALLKQLTGGPGNGEVEKTTVFSGKEGVKITPMQRYERAVPGWKYRIVEKPKPGEYRYLRFAWKADGCRGIMVQLHDEKDWNIRYTAGLDVPGWGTKFVADKPPSEWAVVTCDLFKDFGERTIQGIALTAFEGRAGYFDHVYFGRTVDDLDRIDATGVRGGKPNELTEAALDQFWADLADPDAARAYLAFWSFASAPKQAVLFLRGKLRAAPAVTAKQVERWVRELDDDDFAVRERASGRLREHVEAAAGLLERVIAAGPSAEVRSRIERLLGEREDVDRRRDRVERSVRVLEFLGSPEARRCLEGLAKDGEDMRLKEAAQAALNRLDGAPGK